MIVIGAGLSGLVCARRLQTFGLDVRVVEKSRSLGGRCASRRFEGAVIDTGVPYFTDSNRSVFDEISGLIGSDWCEIQSPVFDANMQMVSGVRRFFHQFGNNRLGKILAAGLDVKFEHLVTTIEKSNDGFLVDGAACDAVVLSAPWNQSSAMLGIESSAIYQPCLTAAFAYNGPPSGPGQMAFGLMGVDALEWSACENAKPGRVPDGLTVMIAQADPEFSAANFDVPPEVWGEALRAWVEMRWEIDPARFRTQFTHRWKFSRRVAPASALDQVPAGCFLTGDSICESRVESVWQSGVSAADSVFAWLDSTPSGGHG